MSQLAHEPSEVARYFAVLAETMPCPVIQFGPSGRVLIANSLAQPLLTEPGPGDGRRVLLSDGREFWDAIAAEALSGAPLLSGSARVLVSGGDPATIWYAGFPAATHQGELMGAVVLVYDATSEQLMSSVRPEHADRRPDELGWIVEGVAQATRADAVLLAELEPDQPRTGRTLAAFVDGAARPDLVWDLASSPAPSAPGKPLVVVADGLHDRFADDDLARSRGYRAFAGALVLSRTGERIGALGAYFLEPISHAASARGVLRLFASLAARPLESMRAARALVESEQRAAALFAHGHLPILLIDPASTQVVEANPAASRLYGIPQDELVTMSVLQLAAGSPESLRAEVRSAARGFRDRFVTKQITARGDVRELEVFAGPLEMGGRTLVYAVLHDVTEKRRAEAEAARYRKELELLVQRRTADLLDATSTIEAERERRARVFRDMGLELKTPLQTILGFSETLATGLAGELNAEQMRQVLMIGEAAKKLGALVEDVLEFSRLETGAVEEMRVEPFDLRHLAEQVVVSARAEAADKGLTIAAEVPGEPIAVETDRTRLEQILVELVSNALKYTRQGGVTVRVLKPSDGTATIEVADTGVGIPPEELPHVFEEFRHLRTEASGLHEGTGLGLALCKRLAEVLGGRIEVASEVGVGTTFTIVFPMQATKARGSK